MMQQKIEYEKLVPGYEFTSTSFKLDSTVIKSYLTATEDDSRIYEEGKIVPPMAIAALAMAAMSTRLELPAGTIHVSQELAFYDTANVGETLTSYARVNQKVERSKFRMLTMGIKVENKKKATVMIGESSFTLPLK